MERRLEVRSGDGAGKRRSAYERPGDSLVVRLARPGELRRHGALHGELSRPDRAGPRASTSSRRSRGARTGRSRSTAAAGPTGTRAGSPPTAAPHDKATWELIATVPGAPHGGLQRPAGERPPGRPAGSGPRIGRRRSPPPPTSSRWSPRRWCGCATAGATCRSTTTSIPEDSALARPLFGLTPDVMETYVRLTGVRYPWNKYAQVTVTDFIGGMENVGATTLVDWLPDPPRLPRPALVSAHAHPARAGAPVVRQSGDGGELGATTGCTRGWRSSCPASTGARSRDGTRRKTSTSRSTGSTWPAMPAAARPLAAYNSSVVYPKGALVLRDAQAAPGPRAVLGGDQPLSHRATPTATPRPTTSARRCVDATGQSLPWFWSQWMYQAGHPEFVVSAELRLGRRRAHAHGAADPAGLPPEPTPPARSVTPLVFRAPMAIRVGTAKGDIVARAVIDQREQKVRIEGVREIAHHGRLRRRERSPQDRSPSISRRRGWPTSSTVTPASGNRSWAIGQLASRPGDTLAGAALAHARRERRLRSHPRRSRHRARAVRRGTGTAGARGGDGRYFRAGPPGGGGVAGADAG